MALRNAGREMSGGGGTASASSSSYDNGSKSHRLGLGRNAPDANYSNLDSATYGSHGAELDKYEPNYDVAGEENPWDLMMDKSGNKFYSNRVTGTVQWERPEGFDIGGVGGGGAGNDALDEAMLLHPTESAQAQADREIPFLKDMVRNCPTRPFVEQFLTGPENYLRRLNDCHGAEGTNVFHHACMCVRSVIRTVVCVCVCVRACARLCLLRGLSVICVICVCLCCVRVPSSVLH